MPEPGELYCQAVDPVWKLIHIYGTPSRFLSGFRRAPVPVGHLFAAHWCQSEVRNGGFLQFFFNSTGILAPEALQAYRAMGLSEWAAIVTEAMRQFGTEYPRDRARRARVVGPPVRRLSEGRGGDRPFDALDDRFYKWLHAADDRWEAAADAYASATGAVALAQQFARSPSAMWLRLRSHLPW